MKLKLLDNKYNNITLNNVVRISSDKETLKVTYTDENGFHVSLYYLAEIQFYELN